MTVRPTSKKTAGASKVKKEKTNLHKAHKTNQEEKRTNKKPRNPQGKNINTNDNIKQAQKQRKRKNKRHNEHKQTENNTQRPQGKYRS